MGLDARCVSGDGGGNAQRALLSQSQPAVREVLIGHVSFDKAMELRRCVLKCFPV